MSDRPPDNASVAKTPSGPIHWRLFAPLVVLAVIHSMTIPLARVATSYKILEAQLPASSIGIVAGAFALLPVFLTVPVGRLNDSRGPAMAMLVGAILVTIAMAGLWWLPASMIALIAATGLLGVGQTMVVTSGQAMLTLCGPASERNRLIGHYFLAISLGQVFGPLLMSGAPEGKGAGDLLLAACATISLAALLFVGLVMWAAPAPVSSGPRASVGLRDILRTPGLMWVILGGSLCLAAADLLLVYLPLAGAQRDIEVAAIGMLLTARALAAAASRVVFARLMAAWGGQRIMLFGMLAVGAGFLALAYDLPLGLMLCAILAAGFGAGITLAATLSVTMEIAPPNAVATAMSIRTTGARLTQFLAPTLASLFVGPLGVGAVFAAMAFTVGASGSVAYLRRPGR